MKVIVMNIPALLVQGCYRQKDVVLSLEEANACLFERDKTLFGVL